MDVLKVGQTSTWTIWGYGSIVMAESVLGPIYAVSGSRRERTRPVQSQFCPSERICMSRGALVAPFNQDIWLKLEFCFLHPSAAKRVSGPTLVCMHATLTTSRSHYSRSLLPVASPLPIIHRIPHSKSTLATKTVKIGATVQHDVPFV